ncbi:MAG: HelD family protein [Tractidigestivibacter sp.]|jgi:DNA helicase-2/ATP-dependent DNA helicase PcrA|uniref:HelD family protein n=1 Tax=Tractidigestivibacter sp. TaxID=2847320 RepID=UPI003D8E7D5F
MEHDQIFEQEQRHLDEVYAKLEELRDQLQEDLAVRDAAARQDLIDMSEEIRPDTMGESDEVMESLAAIETLNSVIDAYNQHHDFNVEKLRDVLLLLRQPYFAKVTLEMRPGKPARDIYIGTVGMTDNDRNPMVVDWRSPVAETYYNQEMGKTSYKVNGRTRTVNLLLRRQFDITANRLNSYFDTTVAIQDSLLLNALKKHHSKKLQAITATIQREQNEVIRHEDVPVLIVNGIAGSGKTSVLLQRVAYLFYQERKTLKPEQVWIFTPNDVFGHYIDTVLPTMGEANPRIFTWRGFMASLGLSERNDGRDGDPNELKRLEEGIATLTIEPDDLRPIRSERAGGEVLLKVSSIEGAINKYSTIPIGSRFTALVKDELHERLERKFAALSKKDEMQERMLGLDVEAQVEVFGQTISPEDDKEVAAYTLTYVRSLYSDAHDSIEACDWLRFDRIGMRLLGKEALSAAEVTYLRLLVAGGGDRKARYVMIDEVQDYTVTQLLVLARYFPRAHFMLLGDQNQAIREGTATPEQIRDIFAQTHGEVEECRLLTSYRSSPEITALFTSLMPADAATKVSSIHREGTRPELVEVPDGNPDLYVSELRRIVDETKEEEGLVAIVSADAARARWIAKQLGKPVQLIDRNSILPESGVVSLDLRLAKGLEFDHVIVADAQAEVYPDEPLYRRRLYTAISRAMHKVTIVSQGPLSPLLEGVIEEG